MFQSFLANQEAAGRLLDDSSNDTWQDILPPPSTTILDSGAQQSMRQSTTSISSESTITDNCPVCQHSPNVPRHTIENCPVVMQLGLRLPDKPPQQTPSFRPATGHPPPSPPTTPMRSNENSNDQGSISESIQRRVAAVEQTMNNGLEELVHNVSQVTGTSFDSSMTITG